MSTHDNLKVARRHALGAIRMQHLGQEWDSTGEKTHDARTDSVDQESREEMYENIQYRIQIAKQSISELSNGQRQYVNTLKDITRTLEQKIEQGHGQPEEPGTPSIPSIESLQHKGSQQEEALSKEVNRILQELKNLQEEVQFDSTPPSLKLRDELEEAFESLKKSHQILERFVEKTNKNHENLLERLRLETNDPVNRGEPFSSKTPFPIDISTPAIRGLRSDIQKPNPNNTMKIVKESNPMSDTVLLTSLLANRVDIASLPKFGAQSDEDIVEFLTKLDLSLSFYQLNDQQKARVIPLLLKNRAYTFFLTLTNNSKEDYKKLSDCLRKEFDAPELKYRKRQELHGIQQKGESITKYLEKVEKLSHNLEVADQTKLDIMIAGLDLPYRNYIQMKQPKSYSDATHALLLKESISPPRDDAATMQSILAAVEAMGPKNDENKIRKPLTCFRCGKPGHIARVCYSKQQRQPRQSYHNARHNSYNARNNYQNQVATEEDM